MTTRSTSPEEAASPADEASPTPVARVGWRGILGVLLLAALVWGANLWRPLDGRTREPWREADLSSIARNYERERLPFAAPAIDWRGDGPGQVEMEFPLFPWLVSVAHRALGYHEVTARVGAYLLSLMSLWLFLLLARGTLPANGAIAAGVFWAINPLAAQVATAIQPEPLMLLGVVGSVLAFRRWLESERLAWFLAAAAATALAVLAKLSALHVGMVLGALLIRHQGWRGLVRPGPVVFAVLSLLPALLWYRHAHGYWVAYGNSLGISNQFHWFGWDLLRSPTRLAGVVTIDLAAIWVWAGAGLGILALRARHRAVATELACWWLGAAGVFYLATARSSGAQWATYYHLFSLPGAALLIGAGVSSWLVDPRPWAWRLGALLTLATVVLSLRGVIRPSDPGPFDGQYRAARAFAQLVPPDALLLVSGGPCVVDRQEVAYNASYFFYWMDRKGWNICREEHSLPAVRGFAGRGARYFVAERGSLARGSGLEGVLRRHYPVLAETPAAVLFRLTEVLPASGQ
ncbi:MAG: glycosyltransferase family 39 protein [Gemmatimonadota bacterium]|nr:glycosyltransferase family 39 protein [Gemmatimonadota bacterium]